MKIAVIELYYHAECLNSFCKAFRDSREQISIYTNEDIYQDLSKEDYADKFQWIVKDLKIPTEKFLKIEISAINQHDIVFLTTVESSFCAFANVNFNPATILRVHVVNSFFNRLRNIHMELKPAYIYRSVFYIIKEVLLDLDWYYLKKLLKKVDYLTFTSEKIRHNFLNANKQNYSILPTIPLAVFDERFFKPSPTDELFYITIPGEVNQKRRDYAVIYNAFKILIPKLSKKIMLTFLGEAKGKHARGIIDKFLKLSNNYFQIKSHNTAIPQVEFNSTMLKTDVLLCPSKINALFKIYNEKAGFTVGPSGSISDIIRYGKPALIPDFYPIDEDIEPIIDRYHTAADLAKILMEYLNGDLQKNKNQKVVTVLEKYRPQNIYHQIMDIFNLALNPHTNLEYSRGVGIKA